MKYDMILAGVGGQGVLSIAAIVSVAAVDEGLHIKQAEVHGMSQRGGAVQSHLRLADHPIYSDLVAEGTAHLLISMEPMEALRYVSFLAPDGVIVAESAPYVNIPDYPDLDAVHAALQGFPRAHQIDATRLAKEKRAARSSNMILLGAASIFIPLPAADLEAAIGQIFGRKGEKVVAQNVEAFRTGRSVIESAAH
jgi:indolepyruvate ferredoxin oxidoreductase beta subunit